MQKFLPALPIAAALVLITALPLRAAETDNAEIRQKLKSWLETNLDVGPAIRTNLMRDADEALKRGQEICLYLDGDNLKARKPVSIFSMTGELFPHTLTTDQAKALGIYAGQIILTMSNPISQSPRLPQPIFQIADMQIDTRNPVPGNQKMTGSFTAKQLHNNTRFGRMVVRINTRTETGGRRELKFYDALPADGRFTFDVNPVNGDGTDPFFGPLPIFIDIMVTGIEDAGVIASNTLVTYVDITPDHEAFAKKSASLMNDLINVLASVKDAATADKAIEEFVRISVKNQAFAEMAARLPPVPPEVERATNAKYNALADEMAARLQAQMTRLEQAPYAGTTFFDRIDAAVQKALKK